MIKSSEFDVAKGCLPQRSRVLQTVVTRLKLMVQLQSLSSMIVTLAISLAHRSFFSFSFQRLKLIRLDEGKGALYISSFSGSQQVCAHATTLIDHQDLSCSRAPIRIETKVGLLPGVHVHMLLYVE